MQRYALPSKVLAGFRCWLHELPRRRSKRALLMFALVLLCFGWVGRELTSPTSWVLFPDRGAEWIRFDQPTNLFAQGPMERMAVFRRRFTLAAPVPDATITYRALQGAAVVLDSATIDEHWGNLTGWRAARNVRLPPLGPGPHDLVLIVRAQDRNPAILARCARLGLRTGVDWEASMNGQVWTPAMLARRPHLPGIAQGFPSPWLALVSLWPELLAVFSLVGCWSLLQGYGKLPLPKAGMVRWGFLALWGILAVNNMFMVPLHVGMDMKYHADYIFFLVQRHRLPLATDGWQMFQAPLYYLLSAPLFRAFRNVNFTLAMEVLRSIPLLCGLIQVEVSFRTMRAVFPGRDGLQMAGTALGGFLPMNLYISQAIGNEPLAGLLSALAILWVLLQERKRGSMLEPSFAMVLGLILGLAMLAKASAILLFLLLTGFCLVRGLQESAQGPGRSNLRPMGRFLAQCWTPAALVAGWYYLRNWWWLGRPFVGGWDGNRGFTWWQDPGYVSFSTLVSFGTALVHPIYAQTAGFWNGLYSTLWLDGSLSGIALMDYRPPWNYGFLMACALLALIPCSIMVWGAVKAFRRPPVALSLACLAAYVAAIFHLHVTQLPVYSTLKATYLLGLIPCLCILAGAGLQALPERPWLKAFVHGAFACFIVTAFLGYFAV